jgi:hypothetical protein
VSGPERPSRIPGGGTGGDLLLAIGLSATLVISLAAAILFAASAALGSLATIPSELGDLIALPAFLLAYSLGTQSDQRRSIVALLLLTVGLQIANGRTTFNPIFLALTIGPWAAGLVVRSGRV